jgi:hypothetical protein
MAARRFPAAYTMLASLVVLTCLGSAAPPGTRAGLESGGIPVDVKHMGHCSAFAPHDWSLSTNPQGSTSSTVARVMKN